MNSMATVNRKDQILMQLTHYFITVENYTPMIVKGVKNEIWLENVDAPYRIIRINTNYIHNNEQLDFDFLKINNIVKQVKRKTLSFSINTLNILLDVGSSVTIKNDKKIDCIAIGADEKIEESTAINALYPDLKNNLVKTDNDIEFIINVASDINKKTEKENREYERLFNFKSVKTTYLLIGLNVLIYLFCLIANIAFDKDYYTVLALNGDLVRSGDYYRLITAAFLHQNIFHILMNMYSLYVVGVQVESFIGKKKYLGVYLISAITGSLLSCIVNTGWSLGASGAIFGLMGAILYFGIHYRLYLSQALKNQIIPLILFNLAISFMIPNIDAGAHIGGLVGGLFATMAFGVGKKENKSDKTNGMICLVILIVALIYILVSK